MRMDRHLLLTDLGILVSAAKDRIAALQSVAELLRSSGRYRWVGLYDVDRAAGTVTNIAWSGPGAPEYPAFPIEACSKVIRPLCSDFGAPVRGGHLT